MLLGSRTVRALLGLEVRDGLHEPAQVGPLGEHRLVSDLETLGDGHDVDSLRSCVGYLPRPTRPRWSGTASPRCGTFRDVLGWVQTSQDALEA